MLPEAVVVKVFGGSLVNRWLIGVYKEVAVVTDDAGARAVEQGIEPEHAVGFPKRDVFVRPAGVESDELRPRF